MNNFDWNGNNRKDVFDEYMDYTISNEENNNHSIKPSNKHTNISLPRILISIGLCIFALSTPFIFENHPFLCSIFMIGIPFICMKILNG